ncbi:hypothetical protein QQP08_020446 [Theobroma cacao]|nr:hypothetical protein QQP08_020446 [Theobroma cacao]
MPSPIIIIISSSSSNHHDQHHCFAAKDKKLGESNGGLISNESQLFTHSLVLVASTPEFMFPSEKDGKKNLKVMQWHKDIEMHRQHTIPFPSESRGGATTIHKDWRRESSCCFWLDRFLIN